MIGNTYLHARALHNNTNKCVMQEMFAFCVTDRTRIYVWREPNTRHDSESQSSCLSSTVTTDIRVDTRQLEPHCGESRTTM